MAQAWVRQGAAVRGEGEGELGVAGAPGAPGVAGASGARGVAGAPGVVGAPGAPGAAAEGGAAEGGAEEVDGGAIKMVEARRSFEALRGEIEEVGDDEIIVVRVDPQRAAALAYGIGRRDAAPGRREAFERVAQSGEYNLATLDRLMGLARAAWYLRRRLLRGVALASNASLLPSVVRAGFERRARMMLVLDYWLGHREDIAAELKYLRQGSGYVDLGNDSEALADLYERPDVRAAIRDPGHHYRPDDAGAARDFADQIFRAHGPGPKGEVERLSGLARRASTLMLRTYEEHRACGQFLFRHREDVTQSYPSIVTALRHAPAERAPIEAPEGDGGEAPAGGGEGPAGPVDEGPLAGE